MRVNNKLSTKVFIYSALVSSTVALLVILYFIFLLPGIYTRDKKNDALEEIVTAQLSFNEDFNREQNIKQNYFAFNIDKNADKLVIKSKFIPDMSLLIKDEDIRSSLMQIIKEFSKENLDFDSIKKINLKSFEKLQPEQLDFLFIDDTKLQQRYETSDVKVHRKKGIMIVELSSSDKDELFINYLSIHNTKTNLIITSYPMTFNKFQDLSKSIISILPAVVLMLIVIVIALSYLFSRKINNPIDKLVKHSRNIKNNYENFSPIQINDNFEMHELSLVLNSLHEELVASINEVKNKNESIIKAKNQQDIFLIASSHQLKTPIAAALLVLEGMIEKIGKYSDYEAYLPVIKAELITMNKIVNDIMDLNLIDVHEYDISVVYLDEIINECLTSYYHILETRRIKINYKQSSIPMQSNNELLSKIIDNLIGNAIKYSKDQSNIDIITTNNVISIYNYGINIEPEVLINIFEPFVRSINTGKAGNGLGLYIVQDYAQKIGIEIKIKNIENGVCVSIII